MSNCWWLGVILAIIGFILLIIGIFLSILNKDISPTPWYIWFLMVEGLILILIAGLIAIFVSPEPPSPELIERLC